VAGPGVPLGTLAVNVLGSALLGLVAGWLSTRAQANENVGLFLATGLLGGFTTFSAFSLDAVGLWQRGAQLGAVTYIIASLALSIAGLCGGLALARSLGS